MPAITDPNEPYFKDGIWGWISSVWHKLAMVWGYSEPWAQTVTVAAVGAGNAVASTTPVSAGYVYVLQGLNISHDAGTDKDAYGFLFDGANIMYLLPRATTPTAIPRVWVGEIRLSFEDIVSATVITPGAGKAITLRVWGYKMLIAE